MYTVKHEIFAIFVILKIRENFMQRNLTAIKYPI